MDQTVAQLDHRLLQVADIAKELSVDVRTVYNLRDKKGWEKVPGRGNRVFYNVPQKDLDEYKEQARLDQSRSGKSIQTVSMNSNEVSQPLFQEVSQKQPEASVTFSNDQFMLLISDKDARIAELKEEVAVKDTELHDLRRQLQGVLNRVNRLEGEMSGKDETIKQMEARLTEKDNTIKAKDETINAAQGMVMLLEQQKQTTLETSTIEPARQLEEKPAGWWGRMFGKK